MGIAAAWLVGNKDLIEVVSLLATLAFTSASFRISARVERAKTQFEVIRDHREVWAELRRAEYRGIFSKVRDISAHPPTDEEIHGVNLLLNHLLGCFNAERGGIYVMPECVDEDIRGVFGLPVPAAVWERMRAFQDRRFARFIDTNRGRE